jgi:acetyltransferase-like isoleucine patch superfamily enzyme
MSFHRELAAELDALFDAALDEAGLFAAWNPSATVETREGITTAILAERNLGIEVDPEIADIMREPWLLAEEAPRRWPAALLALWKLGFVYLRDQASDIAATVQLDNVFRLIVRRSRLGHFTVLERGPILIVDSAIGSHCLIAGAAALVRSTMFTHGYVGRDVLISDCFFASYAKAQVSVKVSRSLVGAYAGLDGGTHPEQYPLNAEGKVPAGVVVGPHSWLGHHTALLAGTRTGDGVVVGSGTTIAKEIGDHVFMMGSPPRAFPVDVHVRALAPAQAFAAGLRQGPAAAVLPVYDVPLAGFVSPRRLEIDYPRHGVLRQLAGERLLDFHRGALQALINELLPEHGVSVSYTVAESVRFTIELDRAVTPLHRLTPDHPLSLSPDAPPDGLDGAELEMLTFLRGGPCSFEQLQRAVGEPDSGISPMTSEAIFNAVHRLSELGLLASRLLRWRRRTQHREDAILASFADPSGARCLPPLQPVIVAR